MRGLLVTVSLILVAVAAAAAEPLDTPEARKAAAEGYMQTIDFSALIDSAFMAGAQTLPEEGRQEYMTLARKHLRIDALRTLTLAAMVKHFTTRELAAMSAFYGSAEGQSSLAKMGPYMSDLMPALQVEIARAVAAILAEIAASKAVSSGT